MKRIKIRSNIHKYFLKNGDGKKCFYTCMPFVNFETHIYTLMNQFQIYDRAHLSEGNYDSLHDYSGSFLNYFDEIQ